MNEFMKDCALQMLAQKIQESQFNLLNVTKQDESMIVSVDGETYGIIGALGAIVADVSKNCGAELDEFINYVHMAAQIAIKCAELTESHEFQSTESMMKFFNSCFKEGDK